MSNSFWSIRAIAPRNQYVAPGKSLHSILTKEEYAKRAATYKEWFPEYRRWKLDQRIVSQFPLNQRAKAEKQKAIFEARYPELQFEISETTPISMFM